MLLTIHPLLVPWSWKSRVIPLPTLWTTTGPVTGTLYLSCAADSKEIREHTTCRSVGKFVPVQDINVYGGVEVRGGADKSLARPGKKQAVLLGKDF